MLPPCVLKKTHQDSPQLRQELFNRQVINTVIAQAIERPNWTKVQNSKRPLTCSVQMLRNKVCDKNRPKSEWAATEERPVGHALSHRRIAQKKSRQRTRN